MSAWLGGIEAGGSKFRCAIADARADIAVPGSVVLADEITIATEDPQTTLQQVCDFFARGPNLKALGIGSFGPLCMDTRNNDFGSLLKTPKLAWQNVNLLRALAPLDVPMQIHTDVTAAALAEYAAHASTGAPLPGVMAYITVGTGLGAAVLVDGQPLPVPRHAEFGHQFVRRHPADAGFPGCCPFHDDCLEGLASAVAMAARWRVEQSQVAGLDDELAWQIEADYLAQACVSLLRSVSVQRIVLGGGIMQRHSLLAAVVARTGALLGDYYAPSQAELQRCIVAPLLHNEAGLHGALLLARQLCAA